MWWWIVCIVLVSAAIEVARCDDEPMNLLRGDNIRDFTSHIINSETAEDGRYNYAQVSIQYPSSVSDTYLHQCGGSIIAPDMILTAAHCRNLIDRIYIDVYNVLTDTQNAVIYTVQNITIHPQYEKELFRFDFAIIHINQVVENIIPIRLNNNSSIPVPADNFTVLGWGAIQVATATTSTVYPQTMQKGTVQSISNDSCESTVINGLTLYEGEIYDEMLCAEGPGVDACSGDSGGPLISESLSSENDVQVGVVSWGRGCAVYPGVYSRISSGYNWIRSEVCYRSVDPPSYMGCNQEERNPIYVSIGTPDADGTAVEGNMTLPTVSPITTLPVAVPASPITSTPVTSAPTASSPIRNSSSRPLYIPSRSPVAVRTGDTFPPVSSSSPPSSGPSNTAVVAPIPKQQIASDVRDSSPADTSSSSSALGRSKDVNTYNGLLIAGAAFQIFWSTC